MYLLNFLRGDKSGSAASSSLYNTTVEYRLACSGELYNGKVLAFDWRKSDATRILLRSPFEMFVVSRPFNSYPQELALRFAVDYVREESGNCSSIFLPDEEIVEDLCAFRKFLTDYASAEIWEEDPLFIVPENLRPDRLDFEKVLGSIYEMRSQSLHAGSSFPRSVGLGTSPSYAVRDLPRDMFKKADIPAVAWFERAVSKAAQNLLREQTGVDAPPFAAQAVAPRNLRDVERRVEDHKAGTGAAQEANIADPIRPHGEAQGAPERVSVGSAELFVRSRIVALRHP